MQVLLKLGVTNNIDECGFPDESLTRLLMILFFYGSTSEKRLLITKPYQSRFKLVLKQYFEPFLRSAPLSFFVNFEDFHGY